MRIKELEYKRIILKIDGDEEKERILSVKYAFEDCYEKIDEMDYYRKWFQHLHNIEEQRRKNLKQQANLKANANKLFGKNDPNQNVFR